jgi:hypothetical protein
MKTTNALSLTLCIGILACSARVAHAGEPPAKLAEDALKDAARQLFREGLNEYAASHWPQARAKFAAAMALSPHYSIKGNLADCELQLGMFREAAEHFAIYVREMNADPKSTQAEREDGERRYAQARAKVATAVMSVNVPDAEIYVDGQLAGHAPVLDPIFFAPGGSHTIEVRHEGYLPARATVVAEAGQRQLVELRLWRVTLVPAIAASGLTLAGVVVGGIFTGVANGRRADADALRAQLAPGGAVCAGTPSGSVATSCQALRDAAVGRDHFSTGAAVGLALGGAALVTAATLWGLTLRPPQAHRDQKTSLRLAPILGANQAGLIAGGAW